jgi:hypothetical protein
MNTAHPHLAPCGNLDHTHASPTAMKYIKQSAIRNPLAIGFTVLIERLALLLGRPTRLA